MSSQDKNCFRINNIRTTGGGFNDPPDVSWQDSLARPVTARNSARPFAKKLLVAGLYGCLAWSSGVAQTAAPTPIFGPVNTGPGSPVTPSSYADSSTLDLVNTNFTLAACVTQTKNTNEASNVIMAKRGTANGWLFGLEAKTGTAGDPGAIKLRTQGNTGTADVLTSSITLSTGQRYHVAVVYKRPASGDTASVEFFADGKSAGSGSIKTVTDSDKSLHIGEESIPDTAVSRKKWHGTLADLRIYNTALDTTALKTLSDSCNPPATTPVTPPPPPPNPSAECRRIIGGQIDDDGTVTDEGVVNSLLACYPLSSDTKDYHDPGGVIHHDGIPRGTPRFETYGDPQGTNSRQAMYFDGNTFVEIPMHPEFMFNFGRPFSFALWAVFDNSLHYDPLLKLSDTDGAPQAGLAKRPYFDHRGRILARLATAAHQTNVFSEDRGRDLLKEEVDDGKWEHKKEWIHLAGVFANGQLKLYVDGWPQAQPPDDNDWKPLPNFDFANGTDLKLRIGANASLVSPTRHKGYISSVLIYDRALTDDEVLDLAGATDGVDSEPFANDPCVHEATVTSVANAIGGWESANSWNPSRVPGADDWVLIKEGQTIIMPPEVKTFGDRRSVMGLCIEKGATLQSSFGGSVALAPQFFHNKGKIRAQDDFPKGGRVFISNPEWFVNNGKIVSGSGSKPGARGGRIKIIAKSIRNWGRIQGGGGFYGFCGPNGAKVVPQRGGDVTVRTNTTNRNFINLGRIIGGPGGNVPNACREVGLVPGAGGWVVANAGKQRGIIQGHGGIWVDPTELVFDNRTQISGENVSIVAGEDNTIEANDLSSGAIIAEKVLTLAVGPGGSLDLSKVADKAFQAGEEIKLFVDPGKLLLPAGKTVKDVFDAPTLTQATGKVLSFATWQTDEVVTGEANAKITLPLNLFNAGPAADSYIISVQDSQGWPLCTLPATVTLDSQADTDLDCELTLPETTGVNNVITVTATSDNDPTMQAVEDIEVYVGDLPTPPVAPANAFPYTVSGMIVNTDEQPVMGVKVQIGDLTAQTDDDGYWEIPEVPEGKYPVTVTKDGYSFDVEKEIEVGNSDMTLEILAHSLLALKVQSPTLVEQGEDINYQLTVTNQGKVTTTGVTLTLELSPDVTIQTLTGASGVSCNLETLVCNFPSLSPAGSATVTLVVNNTGIDTLEHKAVLSSNTYPSETRIIETKVRPDLWVSTKCQPNPVPMRGQLQCVVTVRLNDKAEETATGVKLSLPKPMGVQVQSVQASAGQCDTSDPNTILCTLADLTKGSASTVTVNLQLQDVGLLMLRQQAITTANNYSSDAGGSNTLIDIPENIKADVIILLDTTGSMQMELDGTIAAVKELMAKLPTNQLLTMALVEFKDDVRVKAFTQDPKILIKALEGLTVEGGGLCPEASAEALEIGLKHIKDGGTILLATDASPYPEADLTKLGDLLKQKNVKFHALISGDCATSGSVNAGTDSSSAKTDGGNTPTSSGNTTTGNGSATETGSSGAETSGGETSTSSGNAETGKSSATETGSSDNTEAGKSSATETGSSN